MSTCSKVGDVALQRAAALGRTPLAVYVTMCRLGKEPGGKVSQHSLARELGLSVRTVSMAIADLTGRGVLRGWRTGRENRYEMLPVKRNPQLPQAPPIDPSLPIRAATTDLSGAEKGSLVADQSGNRWDTGKKKKPPKRKSARSEPNLSPRDSYVSTTSARGLGAQMPSPLKVGDVALQRAAALGRTPLAVYVTMCRLGKEPGEKVSQHSLARELGLSVRTVSMAIADLTGSGVLRGWRTGRENRYEMLPVKRNPQLPQAPPIDPSLPIRAATTDLSGAEKGSLVADQSGNRWDTGKKKKPPKRKSARSEPNLSPRDSYVSTTSARGLGAQMPSPLKVGDVALQRAAALGRTPLAVYVTMCRLGKEPGEKVSQHSLARELGLSVRTVSMAIADLTGSGVLRGWRTGRENRYEMLPVKRNPQLPQAPPIDPSLPIRAATTDLSGAEKGSLVADQSGNRWDTGKKKKPPKRKSARSEPNLSPRDSYVSTTSDSRGGLGAQMPSPLKAVQGGGSPRIKELPGDPRSLLRAILASLQPAEASDGRSFQNHVASALGSAGCHLVREFPVPDRGDGRAGRIDLAVLGDPQFAIELDRRGPREKSIRKLQGFPGQKFILLRNAEADREESGPLGTIVVLGKDFSNQSKKSHELPTVQLQNYQLGADAEAASNGAAASNEAAEAERAWLTIVDHLEEIRAGRRQLQDFYLLPPALKALRSIGGFPALLKGSPAYFWIRRREFLRSFAIHSQEVA